jgi:hypothetical protein
VAVSTTLEAASEKTRTRMRQEIDKNGSTRIIHGNGSELTPNLNAAAAAGLPVPVRQEPAGQHASTARDDRDDTRTCSCLSPYPAHTVLRVAGLQVTRSVRVMQLQLSASTAAGPGTLADFCKNRSNRYSQFTRHWSYLQLLATKKVPSAIYVCSVNWEFGSHVTVARPWEDA